MSHNLETVRRLTKEVRIQAKYDRSLEVLRRLRQAGIKTKSGVMLGLGESFEEVVETMDDLRSVDCQILTLGQYLQPTPKHLPVVEFIHPDTFAELKKMVWKRASATWKAAPWCARATTLKSTWCSHLQRDLRCHCASVLSRLFPSA